VLSRDPGLANVETPLTTFDISPLVLDRWACPRCRRRELRGCGTRILCAVCGAAFGLDHGVPLFLEDSPGPDATWHFDLTVAVLALNERENVRALLPDVQRALLESGASHELLVIDGGSTDGTAETATALGAQVHLQGRRGYGGAILEALRVARGRYLLTMDADLSHPASFVNNLWSARERGDVVVASRYVPGAGFQAPWIRKLLSRVLNLAYRRLLSLPVRDLSSGFRLYRTESVRGIPLSGTNFESLPELLIKAVLDGRTTAEVPFDYAPRREGRSHVHFLTFGLCYLKTLRRMWSLRSSIAAADYDERAHDSIIPLQRYWQRRRHEVVLRWMRGCPGVVLDVGCGSSRIVQDLERVVGLDVLASKLRYLRRRCGALVQGSVFELPFADETFDGVVCSQVIEHIAGGSRPFEELARVLKPGGLAVIGTPDYGRPWWPAIERAYKLVHPNGYADEHITHYTLPSLRESLERTGFEVLRHEYILGAEMNVLARRAQSTRPSIASTTSSVPTASSSRSPSSET
jgi:dolichol-phosphate mannosyltransferase